MCNFGKELGMVERFPAISVCEVLRVHIARPIAVHVHNAEMYKTERYSRLTEG